VPDEEIAMSDKPFEQGRRRAMKLALGGIVAVPLANVLLRTPAQAAEQVSPDDPQAKALHYTDNSPKKGQYCHNCTYYGGGAKMGPCQIFQGKLVAAQGWCQSWKAAS
jgi:hypothetical protein